MVKLTEFLSGQILNEQYKLQYCILNVNTTEMYATDVKICIVCVARIVYVFTYICKVVTRTLTFTHV